MNTVACMKEGTSTCIAITQVEIRIDVITQNICNTYIKMVIYMVV